MPIATSTHTSQINDQQREVYKDIETGADNTILAAVSGAVPAGELRRLVSVEAHYDGTATQAGVTVTRNSGDGAAYDTIIDTGSANAEDGAYNPGTDIYLFPGDQVTVTCPAGGAGIAAAVTIVTEKVTSK